MKLKTRNRYTRKFIRNIKSLFLKLVGIVFTLVIIYKITINQTNNSDNSEEFYDEAEQFVMPLINKSDNRMCYKNFVYNKRNEKYRFIDIMDDDILNDSNGQNIFLHLTNCIYDGIPEINLRFERIQLNLDYL